MTMNSFNPGLAMRPQQTQVRNAPTQVFKLALTRNAFVIAYLLLSMSVGVQAHKAYDSIYILGGFVSTGLAALYLFSPKGNFFQAYQGRPVILIPACALLLVVASAIMSGGLSAILKSLILVTTFILVASRMAPVTSGEMLTGYAIFAVLETIFILATRGEWNANALCNHIMFASFCGIAAFSSLRDFPARKFLALGCVVFATFIGITFNSRTATLAFLVVLTTYVVVRSGRFHYRNLRFIGIACLLTMFLFSGDILGGITEIAIENLNNDNPIARFFLDDKSVSKLEEGLFDRKMQWEAAFNTMMANPVLGIGYSKELPIVATREFRAHNAYLEIGYQCGILAMVLWALVYYGMVEYSAGLIRAEPRNPIVFLSFVSAAYLMLAGVMESSGMASAGTPGNWIAVACFAHLKTRTYLRQSRA